MAATDYIQRGGFEFDVFEKSIRVTSKHDSMMLFYGREPEDSDIDALCRLIDMGAAMQSALLRDALAGTTLFPATP
jgi:hypothetical protein